MVNKVAIELQLWVNSVKERGLAKGKRWVFSALLANGREMVVHQLGSVGPSLIKLEGQLADGSPCALMANPAAIQFLVFLGPATPNMPEHKEVGFHTALKTINVKGPNE